LKRVIQRSVQDPLAEMILGGEVRDGDHVKIAAAKSGLTFNGKLAKPEIEDDYPDLPTGKLAIN
jgi:ATP-dependent Clp protease ATP-binding subunit ClpB